MEYSGLARVGHDHNGVHSLPIVTRAGEIGYCTPHMSMVVTDAVSLAASDTEEKAFRCKYLRYARPRHMLNAPQAMPVVSSGSSGV